MVKLNLGCLSQFVFGWQQRTAAFDEIMLILQSFIIQRMFCSSSIIFVRIP